MEYMLKYISFWKALKIQSAFYYLQITPVYCMCKFFTLFWILGKILKRFWTQKIWLQEMHKNKIYLWELQTIIMVNHINIFQRHKFKELLKYSPKITAYNFYFSARITTYNFYLVQLNWAALDNSSVTGRQVL